MTRSLMTIIVVILGSISHAVAGPPPQSQLDLTASPRLFDTHFGRYGSRATQVITRDQRGLRLYLPSDPKGTKQTGLYSYFALAGDVEIAADYDVLNIPAPSTGYGSGFGIAIEARGNDGDICVRRGSWSFEGEGIQLVRGTPVAGEMKYETKFEPTKAKSGRIVLRRVKSEVILLTGDRNTEVVERFRVPFTAGTIRTVRFYADCGGSPTVVDGRFTSVRISAEEMTGGIPERERDPVSWWVYVVAIVIAMISGLGIRQLIRRIRR